MREVVRMRTPVTTIPRLSAGNATVSGVTVKVYAADMPSGRSSRAR